MSHGRRRVVAVPAPGPPLLGRGVVVQDGDPVPPAWAGAEVVVVDVDAVVSPAPVVASLHSAWMERRPVVVSLAVDAATFRAPESVTGEPWRLGARFEPWHDRLHFLVWANTYDARGGIEPVWWWSRKAGRLGASEGGSRDVVLPDGTEAWIDGGPRGPLPPEVGAVVHREAVELGRMVVEPPPAAVSAALAPDQLAAVAHGAGPARIVAPAGSGKTRVLTERLRHLLVDRGLEREGVLAVAYNKKAQLELESRATDLRPRVSTLNALGHRLLGGPRVLEEREVRRIVEDLVPTRQRRANTDPLAPYLEGLTAIRLGLRDPAEVEASRDDVPGLAAAFGPFREALRRSGGVDFDEQVYGAVELLLRDGALRRSVQQGHRHLLVDELQDLTPAHVLLLRLLSSPGLDVFGVGDDDQCHPAGTLVETTIGPVPIEALDPNRHRLLSWDGYGTAIRGRRPERWSSGCAREHGFPFTIAARPYVGRLLELRTDTGAVSTTPDHRVYARWTEEAWHDPATTLLYVMRRGDRFRVGTCFLNRSRGAAFGLSFRMRQEGADAGWILGAFTDPKQALVAEKVVAANFGLPQTTFVSPGGDPSAQADIESIFDQVQDMPGKAARLLDAYGRDIDHPFFDRERRGRMGGCTTAQVLRACNVIDGFMELPTSDGRSVRWSRVKVATSAHRGAVYSLSVLPHRNYVADGVVVRNCIYGHAGASPEFLIEFDSLFPGAADHPLEVNYRCPVVVVDAARTLLGYNDRRVPKEIRPGPSASADGGALVVRRHPSDAGARELVEVVQGWLAEGVAPASIAVLTRVNSLLLAPHVALVEAGVPVSSTLSPDVLERTGVRAALAYLRLGASPDRLAPGDLTEVLRRPSRGFPNWITKWFNRSMSIDELRTISERLDDAKVGAKVVSLAEDLQRVADAVRTGTTREALRVVAEDVGLGGAMQLLDGSKGGQTASQLDDLDALQQVADLHPSPVTFERWLRGVLERRRAMEDGVVLSTVHRVKGMEWDRVVVAGVTDGVLPHRLAEDEEEERRVLHVAVTRCRERVVVLADSSRPSPFLGELDGSAPKRAPRPVVRPGSSAPAPSSARKVTTVEARVGLALEANGGYAGEVAEIGEDGVKLALKSGGTLAVRFGETVVIRGKAAVLDPAADLPPAVEAAEEALRAWRLERCRADKVSAFIVASNAVLRSIATARPTSMVELSRIPGMGPTKLDLYGDEILAVLDAL
jgi:superfamily I DNA/RNA helicase